MRHLRLSVSCAALLLVGTLAPFAAAQQSGADEARERARLFADVLQRGEAAGLRPLLPARGKVQLRLQRLGPADGFFSGSQVEALFDDFLRHGAVRSIEIQRVEHDPRGHALARARAELVARDGSPCRVTLQLVLQRDGQRLVLREIRESSR